MESDKVSDDSLFSSLFVIISDNNEESSLLDRIYLLVKKIKQMVSLILIMRKIIMSCFQILTKNFY